MSQSISEEPVFPALPRFQAEDPLTPRWHMGHPCGKTRGKASWESLVRKPRGKATDPLIHANESVTLLLQLGRKSPETPPLETRTDFPGETLEVPQDPCQHWRGILRFWHRLHTRSYAPASMGEEAREAPEQLAWGLAFPEATRAGLCGPRRKSRAPAATRENPEGSLL